MASGMTMGGCLRNNNFQFIELALPEKPSESADFLSRLQHIPNENPVFKGGIIDEDMGHGADALTVLDNGAAAHE